MDAVTLTKAEIGLPLVRATQLVGYCNDALVRAGCTTVRRAAMFLAQIGAESASLLYKEEIGPQPYWDNYSGGAAYHGRTFIQITHDYNYRAFGQWCVSQKLLTDPDYFIKDPAALADDRWAWLGPVWYWTVARPQLNSLADKGDVAGATLAINGGYNNLVGRQARYTRCMSLGSAILPTQAKDWFDMATKADLQAVVAEQLRFFLPRTMSTLRKGTGNKAWSPANSGPQVVDGVGIDGQIAALTQQLAAIATEVAAIKAKVGA